MVQYDEFGPEKILQVYDPDTGMKGFTVIDNTNRGPAKGGIRMTPSVSIDEVARLARAMTWKCALASLPFGGGKSGIVANPRQLTQQQKDNLVKAFSSALKPISPKYYVAAPDINMAEHEMKVYVTQNGSMKSATGKPSNLCVKPGQRCGIPHEYGSTGFGVYHATLIACQQKKINIKNATFAVEGFGNVGTFAAKYLTEAGAKFVAASDSKGTLYHKEGINYKTLMNVKQKTKSVINYKPGTVLEGAKIFETNVDILIPAAMPDVINKTNMNKIKAKIIIEASNIPMTLQIEEQFHKKGILVVPDIIANAGGVISSYAEYQGLNPNDMFNVVEKKIVKNTKLVLDHAQKEKTCPRSAALEIAMKRVKENKK